MIAGFDSRLIETAKGPVFAALGGAGAPVLLLHGFPETHLMWREIAPRLAKDFSVVCADLPGYGRSGCPPSGPDHFAYSKRAMAAHLLELMTGLGHKRFAVVGHDRGGRVAYRMALDHVDVVTKVCVLDVVPTGPLWDRADSRLMLAFWPFSLLAQPAPLPEQLVGACPDAVVANALSNWGSPSEIFPAPIKAAYADMLRDPARVHAICEEYRAAASCDRDHDQADIDRGHRIRAPLLALWSEKGGINDWYRDEGGPVGLWKLLADHVCGYAVAGGHFFPEEHPDETADELRLFFAATKQQAIDTRCK